MHPGYIAIGDFGAWPELAGSDRVRIDIEPLTGGHRYWAFVTVTSNETQHVTTITPQ